MDNTEKPDHVETFKRQIDQALEEIEKLKDQKSKILSAEDLEKFEKDIVAKTDRLAGLLTAKAIQESLDSDEMSQKSTELIKSMPHRMESQGIRDVKITPARGGPVTVKAAYYTKKKKSKRKKKNRKRCGVSWSFPIWRLRSLYTRSGIAGMFDRHYCCIFSGSEPGNARSRC